jgi:polyribonucleotide nucleotidyltransferase
VLDVDQRGRIKLSIKELLEDEATAVEETAEQEFVE